MRRVPRTAAEARPSALRALRRADGLAGPPLPRVRRAQARVRVRAGRGRLRRRGSPPRHRLEGARPARARRAKRPASSRRPCRIAGAVTLTFVPPDPTRRLERGHHPAERLAEALAARWQLSCEPLLARAGAARRQRGLPLPSGAGTSPTRSAPPAVRPRGVLLVDDVYTSGATVSAAATALRVAGARTIDVVTFARAMRSPGMVLKEK